MDFQGAPEAGRRGCRARSEAGRADAGTHGLDRVAQVVDVAQRVRPAVVAHEAEQIDGQGLGHLARHREVLVLLLAQPRDGVGDVEPDAGRGRAVGAAPVVHAAGIDEHRTARHCGGLGVAGAEGRAVGRCVAADDDPGCAVLLGEVGQRPDRVALDVVAGREGEEVESPLVPVNWLGGLAGTDGNGLGQMKLDVGRVSQERPRRAQRERVHDEVPGRGRAGDEGTGAARQIATEVVRSRGRGIEEGTQLRLDAVQHHLVGDALDDHGAVAHDGRRHIVGAGIVAQAGDGHALILDNGRRHRQLVVALP